MADCRVEDGRVAFDTYRMRLQITLDPRFGIDGPHGLFDRCDAMAAAHVGNAKFRHGRDLLDGSGKLIPNAADPIRLPFRIP